MRSLWSRLDAFLSSLPLASGGWPMLKKAWSLRLALFWGAFNGALFGLSVFADIVPPTWFLALNVIGYATISVARVVRQPGADI